MQPPEPRNHDDDRAPVICRIKGRLGNHLFQYWVARKVADDLKRPLHIYVQNGWPYLLDARVFPNLGQAHIHHNQALMVPIAKHDDDFDWITWSKDYINKPGEVVFLDAYAESCMQVERHEAFIRRLYWSPMFRDTPDNRVAIHVRLGDLAEENMRVQGYVDFCADTVKNLISRECNRNDPIEQVLVVSEEPGHPFTHALLQAVKQVVDRHNRVGDVDEDCTARVAFGGGPYDDFMTLRNSRFIIMQNSTFSWWAGFLANPTKTTVYAFVSPRLGAANRNGTILVDRAPRHFTVHVAP